MPKVSNLKIKLQTGTDSTYLATWDFTETTKVDNTTTSGSAINVGSLVTIKSGATWYNGVAIPSWVMADKWYVYEIRGARVVLNKNQSGTHAIMSPIHINNLNGGTTTTTTSTTINTTDHYTVTWYYDSGDNIWFEGSSGDTKNKYSTYGGPSNARRVRVNVLPVSKTRKVNGQDTAYWTGTAETCDYSVEVNPPETPGTPSVEIDKYKLTATLDNISDARTDKIQFEIYNDTKRVNVGTVTVQACKASYSCTVTAGGKYRVRCRSINLSGDSEVYSTGWSSFTSEYTTIPITVKNVRVAADTKTSVKVEWDKEPTAKSYKVEYTDKVAYFDTTSVSSQTVENSLAFIVGLESGKEWFFRVCASNSQGDSAFSDPVSVTIGTKPASPTTWSSTTVAIVGEALNLYWIHNSADGSSQTFAELELTIDGSTFTHTIKNTTDEDLKDKTSVYSVNTSSYKEGTTIKWRVRTAGATKEYGDWSVMRTVEVYAQPTLELKLTDQNGTAITSVTSFPFYISGLAGPNTQAPIGYHVLVTANQGYYTVDEVGNQVIVSEGDSVYSKYFDTKTALLVELSANNINLENSIDYTITVTVSMNSGLTAVSTKTFAVSWLDDQYEPDVEISIDTESYSAFLRPYCIDSDNNPIADIMLSVYRREFDGSFTEIIANVDNTKNIYVTDPHPALNYARYRIVAISKSTGAVSYYDPPGYPVNGKAVIIQWDDQWRNLEDPIADEEKDPPWSGSMLKLPYNIDVSDSYSTDSDLVEYIGRKYPVAYYGTQLGSTSTWNMDIPADDKETLYGLRRLATWTGNVYVREPSGSGYWANISVSLSQKHLDLTIPVALSITRVEGGM